VHDLGFWALVRLRRCTHLLEFSLANCLGRLLATLSPVIDMFFLPGSVYCTDILAQGFLA
jgi:hypothetical protein